MPTSSELDPLKNVQQMSKAIALLAKDREGFERVARAFDLDDTAAIRRALRELGLIRHCRFICMWFCSWRCERVCFEICERIPGPFPPIEDLRQFALASATLAQKASAARLEKALSSGDKRGFNAAAAKLIGDPRRPHAFFLCRMVCRWFCTPICFRRCRLICVFRG